MQWHGSSTAEYGSAPEDRHGGSTVQWHGSSTTEDGSAPEEGLGREHPLRSVIALSLDWLLASPSLLASPRSISRPHGGLRTNKKDDMRFGASRHKDMGGISDRGEATVLPCLVLPRP